MNEIKILASDLDGTLLDNDSNVSEKNLLAIDALARRGIHFVPSTGRTFGEIHPTIRENPNIRYFIHSNGAVVFDKKTGKKLLKCLSTERARIIFDLLEGVGAHIVVRHGGECYCDPVYKNKEAYEYYRLCYAHVNVVEEYAIEKESFPTFVRTLDDIEVVSAFFHDDKEFSECKRKLLETGYFRITSAADYNLEIFNRDAGKGDALLRLADMLGIARENTAAVGDSGNDLTIVKAAGVGFAVSNATDELKAASDKVICSNNEDAIDYIKTHFIK